MAVLQKRRAYPSQASAASVRAFSAVASVSRSRCSSTTSSGAFAMNWAFIWIGVLVKKPETTQIAGMLVTFPLMFASSAYVPVASLPGWLQAVAKVNPLTYAVDAARGFSMGDVVWSTVGFTLLICTALCAVAATWAARALRPL